MVEPSTMPIYEAFHEFDFIFIASVVKVDIEKALDGLSRDFFVGTWEPSGGSAYGTWVFQNNGYCSHTFVSANKTHNSTGTWEYNAETGMLTTTITKWKWLITNATSDEWTGDNGQSYKRVK